MLRELGGINCITLSLRHINANKVVNCLFIETVVLRGDAICSGLLNLAT